MELTAPVECGKYFKADRGTLTLTSGNLRFESDGRCLFDVPLSSIQKVVWHWYSLSAAFEATIAGQNYFLSFVPRAASLNQWYSGLVTGRRWRAALEGRTLPESAPGVRRFWIFLRIAQIFVLGCSAIVWLGVAMAPAASTLSRTLGATGAVVAGLGAAVLIGFALRGKK
jgi:hypothetical protein